MPVTTGAHWFYVCPRCLKSYPTLKGLVRHILTYEDLDGENHNSDVNMEVLKDLWWARNKSYSSRVAFEIILREIEEYIWSEMVLVGIDLPNLPEPNPLVPSGTPAEGTHYYQCPSCPAEYRVWADLINHFATTNEHGSMIRIDDLAMLWNERDQAHSTEIARILFNEIIWKYTWVNLKSEIGEDLFPEFD